MRYIDPESRPRCYRGYPFTMAELEWIAEFKREGAIPRQARPENYAVSLDMDCRLQLWKRTRSTINATYERQIASRLRSVTETPAPYSA